MLNRPKTTPAALGPTCLQMIDMLVDRPALMAEMACWWCTEEDEAAY